MALKSHSRRAVRVGVSNMSKAIPQYRQQGLRQDSQSIAEILAEYKSMPFLELAAVSELDHKRLRKAISVLEERGFVKVTNPDSVVDEIITLKETGVEMVNRHFRMTTY